MTRKNAEKSTFEEIWSQLNRNQRRFVVAMQEYPTKAEAAKAVDIEPNTVYKWPNIVDEAIRLMGESIADAACDIIAQATAKAAMVKAAGLDSTDERIRQGASTDILDRRLGTAIQRSEVGISDSIKQLFVQIGALAASCITDPEQKDAFMGALQEMMGGDDA